MTTKKEKNLIKGRSEPILRKVALSVELSDITSKRIKSVIGIMKKALHGEEDGVAIAAPQVGEGLRIFMVKGGALALAKGKTDTLSGAKLDDLVFINPEIIKVSKKKKMMEEGCLSVRWLYGEVERHEKVTITAYDELGNFSTFGAGGLIAQIFQHEIDHLNGVLFIDKAENVKDMPPQVE